MELLLQHKICYIIGTNENNWHSNTPQEVMFTNTFKLPVAGKNNIYKYFQPPNHSSLLELLLKNVYKYFQLPNHSSLLELRFKSKVNKYFQHPRP